MKKAILIFLVMITQLNAAVLLRDDFSGTSLDASVWDLGTWTLGRTRLANSPVLDGGVAKLQFDTYNPVDPRGSFVGTEIYTQMPQSLGSGIEFEASIRVPDSLPSGLITSFFSYTSKNVGGTQYVDELDFEFLTKTINESVASYDPVLTTAWSDWNSGANIGNWRTTDNQVNGLDLNTFTKVVIRWEPDKVEWFVNEVLIQTETDHVPDDPTQLRFNFWATDNSAWTGAYDASLQPTANAAENETFFYEVDYVEVRSIPEPSSLILLSSVIPLLLRRGRD